MTHTLEVSKQLSRGVFRKRYSENRFEKFEKDRKEKQKVIEDFQEKVSMLSNKDENMENSIDKQGQHSSRNCLLIHGIQQFL